ncbi:hypothetical protein IQ07DRAFT_646687 [Pyrenochaeta sp. DS3sAY3a]|nr:hypothetical protein IQ07DRAFT_646687 [Pyrenochaeta sp. DS3sAY3a]
MNLAEDQALENREARVTEEIKRIKALAIDATKAVLEDEIKKIKAQKEDVMLKRQGLEATIKAALKAERDSYDYLKKFDKMPTEDVRGTWS